MKNKIRFSKKDFDVENNLFISTKIKEVIIAIFSIFFIAIMLNFLLISYYNFFPDIYSSKIEEIEQNHLASYFVLCLFLFFIAMPFFLLNLRDFLHSVCRKFLFNYFDYQFLFIEELSRLYVPDKFGVFVLDKFVYHMSDTGICIFLLNKKKEDTQYVFDRKKIVPYKLINEDDLDNFIFLLDKKCEKLSLVENEKIFSDSAAKDKSENEKIAIRNKVLSFGLILFKPFYPTFLLIMIFFILIFSVPFQIIFGGLSLIISALPFLVVGTGIVGSFLIPLAVLVGIIFLIKLIWINV